VSVQRGQLQLQLQLHTEIQRVLLLKAQGDYGFIIDSYYLFEDTERAKTYIRENGLSNHGDRSEIGLAYLKFYGVMNACYMQHEATPICARKLGVEVDRNSLVAYKKCFLTYQLYAASPFFARASFCLEL